MRWDQMGKGSCNGSKGFWETFIVLEWLSSIGIESRLQKVGFERPKISHVSHVEG